MPKEKPLITDAKDIRINEQAAIQAILGNPPNWMLRWGITLVAVIAIAFATMSWVIKYPDVVQAQVVLTTENPPIRVVSTASGRIEKWLVQDQDIIQEGAAIAELHNTAKTTDVLSLETFLKNIEQARQYSSLPASAPTLLEIGALQNGYSNFLQAFKELHYLAKTQNVAIRIQSLNNQIEHINALTASHQKQSDIYVKEAAIAKKDWERHQYLFKIKGCTEVELEQRELTYLQYQRQLENLNTTITNNQLQIEQMKMQIAELNQNLTDGINTKFLAVKEHARRLQSDLQQWKNSFLITAPISGRVSLTKVLAEQQFVNTNDEILTIVPDSASSRIVARAFIPTQGAGKIEAQMKALISFANYPQQEFGVIEGQVNKVSLLPLRSDESSGYLVLLDIPQDLTTNYNKSLPFDQEMEGQAQIITKDKRIIERVLENLTDILKNKAGL